MKLQSRSCKRKKSTDNNQQKNKYRKINVPTNESNGNQSSCSTSVSRHEMLVDLIRRSREDSEHIIKTNEGCSTSSTSKNDLKTKCIQQLYEDMNEIDVVDIRKRKLARMWSQKQKLERKIDDKIQEQEIFNQDDTKSVELSLAMTAAKLQKMEKHRRSQLEKLLSELKEYRNNNWELMYMLYQSKQENEDLKVRLRNLYKRQKNQRSSVYLWKRRKLVFEERKAEAILNCILILMCAYILYQLAVDAVLRSNRMVIEEIELSPERHEHKEVLE